MTDPSPLGLAALAQRADLYRQELLLCSWCQWPFPTTWQQCCPCLSCTSAFCCVVVFYVLPKGKEMGQGSALCLCGCWLRAGMFDWWNNNRDYVTTCQRPFLWTGTLISVPQSHWLSVAGPSVTPIWSSFFFQGYNLEMQFGSYCATFVFRLCSRFSVENWGFSAK